MKRFMHSHHAGQDETIGLMPWVMKPVRTDDYALRTGNGDPAADAKSYAPGTNIDLFVLVKRRDFKYRGACDEFLGDNWPCTVRALQG